MKSFEEIVKQEKIKIPTTIKVAKRVQRFSSQRSVDFIFDEQSLKLIEVEFPLDCRYVTAKKIAENLVVLNREKHRKNDRSRLDLMEGNYRGYRDKSFYYSIE